MSRKRRSDRRSGRRRSTAAARPAGGDRAEGTTAGEATGRQGAPTAGRAGGGGPSAGTPTAAASPTGLGWRWAGGLSVLAAAVRAAVAWDLADLALYRQPQLDQLEFLIWARGLIEQGFSWPALPTKGPGYAVFLALLLALSGESLPAVRLVQALAGALTCVAGALLAARHFGRPAGVAAGLLLAVYGPLVWIDTMLLAEGLFLLLLVLALVAFLTAFPPRAEAVKDVDATTGASASPAPPSWRFWGAVAATGLLLGAAALVRATALALVPVFALLVLMAGWRPRRTGAAPGAAPWRQPRRWAAAALLAGSALALVLPVTTAMGRTTGSSLLIQGYGGLNLYMGNHPDGSGLPSARPGGDWDRLDGQAARAGYTTAAEQDRYFAARARAAIAERPLAWLGLLAEKALWLIQAEEIRESHSYSFFRRQSLLLSLLPGWALLFPLSCWGLVVALRRRRAPAELLVYLLVFAATAVGIIMGSRYRLPMVPVVAVFAGLGLAAVGEDLKRMAAGRWAGKRAASTPAGEAVEEARGRPLPAPGEETAAEPSPAWRRMAVAVAVIAVAAAAAQLRHHPPSRNLAEEWALSGNAELAAGDPAAAEAAFEAALAEDPDSALAWEGMARLRLQQRDLAGSAEAAERALALNPDFALAHDSHARVLLAQGRPAVAAEALRRALEINPDYLPSLELLGPLLLERGEVEEAAATYRRIVELQPANAAARLGLARIAGARRQPEEGMGHAARAAELDPESLEAWMTLALLALDAGDAATAGRAVERAEALAGAGSPEVLWARALLARLEGRAEVLDATLRRLLTLRPGFPPARQLFLANATALGRRAEAEAYLSRLGSPAPPPG